MFVYVFDHGILRRNRYVAMLDAEFACIIYDGETGKYIAARDPIGIRPLYYGYDEKESSYLQVRPRI